MKMAMYETTNGRLIPEARISEILINSREIAARAWLTDGELADLDYYRLIEAIREKDPVVPAAPGFELVIVGLTGKEAMIAKSTPIVAWRVRAGKTATPITLGARNDWIVPGAFIRVLREDGKASFLTLEGDLVAEDLWVFLEAVKNGLLTQDEANA